MKAAKGEYIAFLDADDLWMPEHLHRLCAVLDSGKADLAYSDCFVYSARRRLGEMELLPAGAIEVKNPAAGPFSGGISSTLQQRPSRAGSWRR
jgi:glycosyltransferase involved in cell wall biosynthesis